MIWDLQFPMMFLPVLVYRHIPGPDLHLAFLFLLQLSVQDLLGRSIRGRHLLLWPGLRVLALGFTGLIGVLGLIRVLTLFSAFPGFWLLASGF